MTHIQAAGLTRSGPREQHNEDAVLVEVEGEIAVLGVFDGVGGNPLGEVASAEAARLFRESLRGAPDKERLHAACRSVNERLIVASSERGLLRPMGCVGTVAWIQYLGPYARVLLGHVGDTRAFCVGEDGSAAQLTHDQSANSADDVPEAESLKAPDRNLISAAYGMEEWPPGSDPVEVREAVLRPKEVLLLLTDGITDFINRSQLTRIVSGHVGDVQSLVEMVASVAERAQGAPDSPKGDNLGIVAVRLEDVEPRGHGTTHGVLASGIGVRNIPYLGIASFFGAALGVGILATWNFIQNRDSGPTEPRPSLCVFGTQPVVERLPECHGSKRSGAVMARFPTGVVDLTGQWGSIHLMGDPLTLPSLLAFNKDMEITIEGGDDAEPTAGVIWQNLHLGGVHDVRVHVEPMGSLGLHDVTWVSPQSRLVIELGEGAWLDLQRVWMDIGDLQISLSEGARVEADHWVVRSVGAGKVFRFDGELPKESWKFERVIIDVGKGTVFEGEPPSWWTSALESRRVTVVSEAP